MSRAERGAFAAESVGARRPWCSPTPRRGVKRGLKALARMQGHVSYAQELEWPTTAPAGAIRKLPDRCGWSNKDADLFEVNVASAVIAMAAMHELAIDPARWVTHWRFSRSYSDHPDLRARANRTETRHSLTLHRGAARLPRLLSSLAEWRFSSLRESQNSPADDGIKADSSAQSTN
jgi:Thiolase, C-terminal domain